MQTLTDRQSEAALLSSVMLENNRSGYLEKLDERDFSGDVERIVFGELRLMVESGLPLDDSPTVARWFAGMPAKSRAEQAGIANLPYELARIWATEFNHKRIDFHFRNVRSDRVRRAISWFAAELAKRNQAEQFKLDETLDFARAAVDEIWQRHNEGLA